MDDPDASEAAWASTSASSGLWSEAAHYGLCHPVLAESASRCFEAALDALDRLEVDGDTAELVARYHERYVSRGRCPADDRLDEYSETGRVLPSSASLEESWT